ncbi:MAG: sigma-54 dependent transcriptional regulator [Candidatus Zixiibacteriota bacterium]
MAEELKIAPQTGKVLVVDDDPLLRDFLSETLRRLGFDVDLTSTGEEAFERIRRKDYDVILSDIRMPNMGGMELLKTAREYLPDAKVVMMTAYGTVQNAVEAMKLGAFEYVMKPFTIDEIELVITRALEHKQLLLENRLLRSEVVGKYSFDNIVGKSVHMQKIFGLVEGVADTRATVLITGESGTGKELIAKAIHYHSSRREGPFIRINCAAIPEGLVESELFGHEKGSFTGAIRQSRGRFELADRGTLLLDEISEISPHLQAKLLRVLQEREFERVGSGIPIQVDVRIIATSNRDLRDLIEKRKFREDLFYRLNVVPIHIAPLRERKEDIPALAQHFLKKYSLENNRQIEGISQKVYEMFLEYSWSGNVRELENYIERAVVTAQGKILTPRDFPKELSFGRIRQPSGEIEVGSTVYEAERKLILKTLKAHEGNRTKTAETLGISTRTLRNKLREYGLKEEETEPKG